MSSFRKRLVGPAGVVGLALIGVGAGGGVWAEDHQVGTMSAACEVQSIRKIGSGIQVDWSPDGRLIGYTKPVRHVIRRNHELFVMNPDGSGQRCLTCDSSRLPRELVRKTKGAITFHPSGRYLLFSAENEQSTHGPASGPGVNQNHDLWVRDIDGARYWRLTHLPKNSMLQYPQFSRDGSQLLWSERYRPGTLFKKGQEFGSWRMKLADFLLTPQGPRLGTIRELTPGGEGFYEPHGFSPDGRTIIFTAVFGREKSRFLGDIYTFDLRTGALANLTRTDAIHDEQARFSPNGSKISFMSGPFLGLHRLPLVYATDLYLMDADGAHVTRLTHFSDRAHADYIGRNAQLAKNAWSPDGTRIVSAYHTSSGDGVIFIVTFQGGCGSRQP